jgi:hypothetical protein
MFQQKYLPNFGRYKREYRSKAHSKYMKIRRRYIGDIHNFAEAGAKFDVQTHFVG